MLNVFHFFGFINNDFLTRRNMYIDLMLFCCLIGLIFCYRRICIFCFNSRYFFKLFKVVFKCFFSRFLDSLFTIGITICKKVYNIGSSLILNRFLTIGLVIHITRVSKGFDSIISDDCVIHEAKRG